jgi:putative nucleotidyltransferase with HDIG domain
VACVGCSACVVVAGLASRDEFSNPLTYFLIVSAALSNISAAYWSDLGASGSFTTSMLAAAFLDPAAACAVAFIAEIAAWAVERGKYRTASLPMNIFASAAPNVAAAFIFSTADPADSTAFYLLFGVVAVFALGLNSTIVVALARISEGRSPIPNLKGYARLLPAIAINLALTITVAAIYREVGLAGAAFVLVAIVGFTYMAHLVVTAQDRTRQYASLSWGVLSGLLRTLDQRDPRSARHAAAVAAFARDIAQHLGMSAADQELAHTAGLLHDIGGFGLSDRVMERGQTLTDEDWVAIRKHPELGADLLKDLGSYGPVADIVRAHHERMDGRGYPNGLPAEEIPELAKIVAVAEVYDTLTADHTYRTPMSSFEALTELRRVSGSQLDGGYVEALSTLLTGRGTEYRHADAADFERELDLERRINEAVDRAPLIESDADVAGPPPASTGTGGS